MPAIVDRAWIARTLTQLAGDRHRVADALFALDTADNGLAYLRTAELAGATRELWERLAPRLDALWGAFRAFCGALDAAGPPDAARPGRSPLTAVSALLFAPIADEDVPAGLRSTDLVDVGPWLTEECRQVTAVVAEVATRLTEVTALTSLQTRLDAAQRAVGAGDSTAALRRLARRAEADPIGTDLTDPGAAAVVAAATDRLDELTRLAAARAGYPGRIAALGEALERLAAAEEAVTAANARATAKIRDPRLPAGDALTGRLSARLGALDRIRGTALDQALPDLEQAVAAAHDAARDRRAFADGLIERREELRGRLEAYRMKAVRSGLGERADVLSAYDDAHALLWTAPCDLAAATRAVVAYQRSLRPSSGGGTA
ncbi:hypothetical protein [Cryptosporangium phraense]|uniref:Uncharacterized protein n=1 Tax=Cryptosporangium phraense TaxID=2593070 RepID=A0A545AIY0_9ACTN|nr:hypothetical protein [Cryptosporangium phraense]TQS40645.1 hypothetical protein FL583_33510 [Cryptosporangium phraense]